LADQSGGNHGSREAVDQTRTRAAVDSTGVCDDRRQRRLSRRVRRPHNQQDGIVTINNATTFCIGLPAAGGFCGSPSWATSRNLQDLAPGDCIRVTYTAADATVDSVTGAWRLPDCHHAPPAAAVAP